MKQYFGVVFLVVFILGCVAVPFLLMLVFSYDEGTYHNGFVGILSTIILTVLAFPFHILVYLAGGGEVPKFWFFFLFFLDVLFYSIVAQAVVSNKENILMKVRDMKRKYFKQ